MPVGGHQSDSSEQRSAESIIRAQIASDVGKGLVARSLLLPDGARVDVDGVADDESVLVEIFAHQGRLKGARPKKVAQDALKLITLARTRPSARLILAFGDRVAAASVLGRSWLAEALRTWNVEVLVVDLEEEVRRELLAAQARQVMVNRAPDP